MPQNDGASYRVFDVILGCLVLNGPSVSAVMHFLAVAFVRRGTSPS